MHKRLPVFVVSKKPMSCLSKQLKNRCFTLQIKLPIAHVKRPPRQPALKELKIDRKYLGLLIQ